MKTYRIKISRFSVISGVLDTEYSLTGGIYRTYKSAFEFLTEMYRVFSNDINYISRFDGIVLTIIPKNETNRITTYHIVEK